MSLPTTPYKGARDFYPQDYFARQYIFNTWRKIAQRYGYEPYDASVIEPIELYQAKTSDEIVSEQTYSFTDRGGREVVLRPEMTPTVSRMVAAKRQELAYPLRLYSIPNMWRYERPQRGRLREHWQLNVDLFGIDNISAELEILSLADSIMQDFGATREMYTIKVNSRSLINYYMNDYLGLDAVETNTLIKLIDRMHKMDYPEFAALVSATISPSKREQSGSDEKLLSVLGIKNLAELPAELQNIKSVMELKDLIETLQSQGISNVEFDASLMRGFMYYTDVVFEVFDNHPDNKRSMFGGGRYDGLVGNFGVEPLPTIGFGMGDVTIKDFLDSHNLNPKYVSTVQATAVLVGDCYKQALPIIKTLREEGVNLAVDSTGRNLDKKLKAIAKSAVPYAIIIGSDEISSNLFILKEMATSKQETHSLERIISIVTANKSDIIIE
ncbi:MAG: histidine--tRNA ligase [Patescibacteria group bacterium]|jgi:histidyl-tRNA synthetase|nr:histidine--tRNA ligase [Patescibacteria group bacterium]